MTLTEKILEKVQRLPAPVQEEVLDFVEFLDARSHDGGQKTSIELAMRGMEDDTSLEFSVRDVKVKYL